MVLEKSSLEKKKSCGITIIFSVVHYSKLKLMKPTGRGAPAEGISHINDALIDHIFSQVDLL